MLCLSLNVSKNKACLCGLLPRVLEFALGLHPEVLHLFLDRSQLSLQLSNFSLPQLARLPQSDLFHFCGLLGLSDQAHGGLLVCIRLFQLLDPAHQVGVLVHQL